MWHKIAARIANNIDYGHIQELSDQSPPFAQAILFEYTIFTLKYQTDRPDQTIDPDCSVWSRSTLFSTHLAVF